MSAGTTLTPKQEKFCLKYIELGNASEAYRQSYDAENMKGATIKRKAAELLENGNITARVRELQAVHFERHIVTVDSITEELNESRKLATADRQHHAAITATMGKAKIHGLVVEKNEHTGKDGKPIAAETTLSITPGLVKSIVQQVRDEF